MIIRNFYLKRIVSSPHKTDAILVIDADTVLAMSISPQLLQAVAGRMPQIIQRHRGVEHRKLPSGDTRRG